MYKGEEKFYTGILILLLIGELYLTVPLSTDSIIKEGQTNFITYLIIGHIIAYGYTSMLGNKGVRGFHIRGIIGFFVSFLPLLPFIWHGYVVIYGIKSIRRMLSYIKYDYDEDYEKKKEIQRLKEQKRLRSKDIDIEDTEYDDNSDLFGLEELKKQSKIMKHKKPDTKKPTKTRRNSRPRQSPKKTKKVVPKKVVKKKIARRKK